MRGFKFCGLVEVIAYLMVGLDYFISGYINVLQDTSKTCKTVELCSFRFIKEVDIIFLELPMVLNNRCIMRGGHLIRSKNEQIEPRQGGCS